MRMCGGCQASAAHPIILYLDLVNATQEIRLNAACIQLKHRIEILYGSLQCQDCQCQCLSMTVLDPTASVGKCHASAMLEVNDAVAATAAPTW